MKNSHLKYLVVFTLAVVVWGAFLGTKKANARVNEPKTVLKLSPSENNPRNSEGDFVNLKDGRILFVYSHYTAGSGGDHDPAFLAGRYSDDGGKNWTQEDEVIVPNEGRHECDVCFIVAVAKRRNSIVFTLERIQL